MNAPIGWSDSAFSHWFRSGAPNGTSGVRSGDAVEGRRRGTDLVDADEGLGGLVVLRAGHRGALVRAGVAHRRRAWRWQSMHSAADGSASRRSGAMGLPHDVHVP